MNEFDDGFPTDEEEDYRPSRTELKREAEALQQLGESLLALKPYQLKRLPLDEELLAAIAEAHRLPKGPAHKRQRQLIGKLMRSRDPQPIRQALENLDSQASPRRKAEPKPEALWLERLLKEGDAGLQVFLEEFPGADRQRLRQFLRTALKTPETESKAARQLLGLIKEALSAH